MAKRAQRRAAIPGAAPDPARRQRENTRPAAVSQSVILNEGWTEEFIPLAPRISTLQHNQFGVY